MAERYHVEGVAVPETLDVLHDLLERVAGDHPDVAAEDLMLFETAVIEIAGNVVQHGLPPGGVTYSFDLTITPEELVGVLSDSGAPSAPDLDRPMPEGYAEEGRGVPLAVAALDRLEYERADATNRWRMTRLRQPA